MQVNWCLEKNLVIESKYITFAQQLNDKSL